ncbi:Rho guanine nucleotide exchange factor scd1 [Termitomyces sp. J132]|nr:Rho guanine nucleotide exchange factor scd1 [Termitomyces sp. J132]
MASVAGRKKSIVASAVQIDSPVANNTLLNKAAASSLYQQCSALRARLLRIRGFSSYFSLPNANHARQSTDPVSHLWDLFSFGIPLCYIFDCLDGFPKINNSTFNPDEYDANPDKPKKRAIALFAMQTKKVLHAIPGCEEFTVTDLWDRNSTDGLVKVINTVTAIVDHLPPHAFEPPSPTASSHPPNDSYDRSASESPVPPANAQETARNNIIRELVETERKYVQDLEIMQKYSNALSQGNIIDQDTIHLLFPNLNKLLNFQRKFLIRFESTAELPWQSQQWGQLFLESEDEFVVYEPYCANYTSASELMLEHEQKLNASALNHLINAKGELPAFLIKPIQRVCKYPLLLDSLIKACNNSNYQHFDELKRGSEAAKRITDKINEAQRRAENEATVKSLQSRIDDWKGHHLENFGELLLDDIFIVTKSEVDREYHVFLFEKIILCCKEALPQPQNGKKMGKSNSILKKQPAPPPLALPGGVGQPVRKNTPLLLKGRIFLGNVTQAIPGPIPKSSPNNPIPTYYPLAVWWKGDDDLEYFTLRCRQQEQVRLWETAINRLIKESAARRASERSALSRIAAASSAYAPTHTRGVSKASQSSSQSHHSYSPYGTSHSMYSSTSMTSATSSRGPRTPYGSDEFIPNTNSVAYGSGNGPSGYHNGFEFDQDSDDYDEHQPSSSYGGTSGRGTPIASGSINGTGYRRNNAMSMPPERDALPAYERPRAHTEGMNGAVMQQWRDNLPPVPTPPDMPLHPNTRGYNPRLNAGMNTQSFFGQSMVDLPVKVKVHFHEDIFVIQVDRATEYGDLVEKVGRKIRLCGPRRDDGPLRVKYKDEDGDMVSLGSTEDVQMAFEAYRPGAPVTLFVT